MTFIIALIALAIERFFDWHSIRDWRWFGIYQTWVGAKLQSVSSSLILVACVVPVVAIVGLINWLLSGWMYGVFELIFGTFILIYCLGPNSFWAQAYKSVSLLQGEDPHIIQTQAQTLFGATLPKESQSFHRSLINLFFIEANRQVFAVIFWFILLGPAGAVLYRTVDLCAMGLMTAQPASRFQQWLDWLPVRLFTFIFALGGHFTDVIHHWKRYAIAPPQTNHACIHECGIAALDVLEKERIPEDGSAEKEALALLDRVFVIALVILAVIVLIV